MPRQQLQVFSAVAMKQHNSLPSHNKCLTQPHNVAQLPTRMSKKTQANNDSSQQSGVEHTLIEQRTKLKQEEKRPPTTTVSRTTDNNSSNKLRTTTTTRSQQKKIKNKTRTIKMSEAPSNKLY